MLAENFFSFTVKSGDCSFAELRCVHLRSLLYHNPPGAGPDALA
jgi:hypothetical protein